MTMTRSLAVVAAILVMGTTAPQAARAARPDSWVKVKAKTALLTTEGVHGTAINVDTVDGRMTLHGKVCSQDEKAKTDGAVKLTGTVPDEDARVTAATVARSTPGVRAVLWEALEISRAR